MNKRVASSLAVGASLVLVAALLPGSIAGAAQLQSQVSRDMGSRFASSNIAGAEVATPLAMTVPDAPFVTSAVGVGLGVQVAWAPDDATEGVTSYKVTE